ncbi:MAG: phage tail tape measure protein [Muribaculum sp.]|nr:phage tail tape measure protein [Muribaculum sp.]
MSATAIQKVIMNLANKNHEFAATLGMDAELLNETLKHSAKDGLLMFLEALQKMGQNVGFENATLTLAPAFKDMGLDAARVSQVLSTLAMHLDEVKWQMGEADRAFNEASSATHEYEIFNNTAQAAIDKARKRVGELAIELGEKLYPIMKHIYTSSGIFLRVLNQLVDFFIEYRREIVMLGISIASYTVIAKGAMVMQKAWNLVCGVASAVARAARIAVLALRIGYSQLTGQITKAEAATRLLNKTTKASPWGIIIALVAAAAGAVYSFYQRTKEAREEAERQRKEMEEWKASLTDLDAASADYSSKEITRLKALYNEATNESVATDKRRSAAEKLQNLYPDYFKNLSIEQIMVGQAKSKYDELTTAIINAARARAAAAKIEENEKTLLELEGRQTTLQNTQRQQQGTVNQRQAELDAVHQRNDAAIQSAALGDSREMKSNNVQAKIQEIYAAQDRLRAANTALSATTTELNTVTTQINALNAANQQLAEKYQISAEAFEVPETPSFPTVPPGGGGGGGGTTTTTDKFAAEKDWREQQEALARIAYAKGETDYITYTKKMDDIAVQFYAKQLAHTDLTATEQLTIEAQYQEAIKKRKQDLSKFTVEEMEAAYNDEVAKAKQHYIDGEYSYTTYTEVLERLELTHLATMAAFYDEGTKERLQAETDLQNALIAQRQKHQQEYEALEAKYAAMKKDYFGDNPQEAQKKYNDDLAMLDIVYQRELAAAGENAAEKLRIDEAYEKAKLALKKKYGLLAEEDTRNAMEKGIAASVEWLNSDGGKALTGTLDTLVSGMSAVFSQLSTLIQAELEIQTASINKRYDAEISRAEGNSYKVKKLEKEKEKEIAKAKSEANRKMFAMQVIQAVAQTATNALNAYGSAAAVPVVGYILAPIAAAMAVAAGAIQIAAIKKQQQASEAQGYAEGGFTPPGGKYEEAGVVHKGEWVASQRLVNNPRTRPLLEALDYAQRTNTIGSITNADVSRNITAPMVLASQPASSSPVIVQSAAPTVVVEQNSEYADTMRQLAERQNEPFGAIVTVAGDYGIERAKEEYDLLMRNKSPKSKK